MKDSFTKFTSNLLVAFNITRFSELWTVPIFDILEKEKKKGESLERSDSWMVQLQYGYCLVPSHYNWVTICLVTINASNAGDVNETVNLLFYSPLKSQCQIFTLCKKKNQKEQNFV